MENLMDDINDLGRLEFLTPVYEVTTEVDLNFLLIEISDNYSNYSINVNIYNKLNTLIIPLSVNKLKQVFENLISNAVSFSPELGSVSIGIFIKDKHIYISFKDSGAGVSDDIIDKITEWFYSFRPQGSNNKHSGLGLSIVQAILNS